MLVHDSRWRTVAILLVTTALPARYGAALSFDERSPVLSANVQHVAAQAVAVATGHDGGLGRLAGSGPHVDQAGNPELRHRLGVQSWRSFLSQRRPSSKNCSAYCKSTVDGRNDTLPNVLIIGDSVSMYELGYFRYVKTALQGVASVQMMGSFGEGSCGTSFGAIDCIDTWLNGGGWDVISFNWGLHDICPKLYGRVSPEEYIKNLDTAYQRMKPALAANGSVVFQDTTPVPPKSNRNITDVYAINMLARALFANYTPPVSVTPLFEMVVAECRANQSTKLYPYTSDCPQLQFSDNVHFTERGRSYTGTVVANSILRALKNSKKVKDAVTVAPWGRRRHAF